MIDEDHQRSTGSESNQKKYQSENSTTSTIIATHSADIRALALKFPIHSLPPSRSHPTAYASIIQVSGTKTEKIEQIGNAMSVSKMKACVGAIMADAAPKLKALDAAEFQEAAE